MEQVVGGRYRLLEKLGSGGMGTVYRALDRFTGQVVALKRVTAPAENLQFNTILTSSIDPRLALAQEFRALASLRHPNIISVRDYGFDAEGMPFYTMDVLENARDILEAGRGASLEEIVGLLIQALEALVYLHRRGFIHRDLKPANVLLYQSTVKVLDFGLSVAAEQITGIVGTLAYMSPEVLGEEPAGVGADLYGVGIIAYEMLTGRHPYHDASSNYSLIYRIMNESPDVNAIAHSGLAAIVGRLLEKDPADRFRSARETIDALCKATGYHRPPESQAIRESFLQAARFVGREHELSQLSSALSAAMQHTGSAWLISGESGVGKTRLLEELRTLALVKGALALRGAAASAGGQPYQVWREPLRRLAVSTGDLSDRESSVLKALVPDIEMLIERPVADAPEIDPQSARARLITTVIDMLRRQNQPIALFLEDLQWAGAESLELFDRLTRAIYEAHTGEMPVLLVASFRDDEAPPIYPRGIEVIKLKRLSLSEISELSASILGAPGRDPHFIEFLQHETEGNVFFLVEVMRALAEEAGQLERIDSHALPAHVVAGGVMLIVRRRLERVPMRARGLLQLAAILGRFPDLAVLEAADPGAELERWLDDCAEVAVFEFSEGQWGFAHDRLREALVDAMSEGERRALHRRVAVAVETVYPKAPERAATLAYFWREAGDFGKEINYAAQAGLQAYRNGAYDDAIRLLNRALELLAKRNTVEPTPAARLQQASLERRLSAANYSVGDLARCREYALDAARQLGVPVPDSAAGKVLSTLRHASLQMAHRVRPRAFLGRAGADRPRIVEAARVYDQITVTDYLAGNFLGGLSSVLRGLNLAERSGQPVEIARLSANFANALAYVPMPRLAERYLERSMRYARDVKDDPSTLLWTLTASGMVYIGLGHWEQARAALLEAVEIADRLKDRVRVQDNVRFLAMSFSFQGEFARAAQMYDDMHTLARRAGDRMAQAYALNGMAEAFLPQGKSSDACAALENAAEHIFSSDVTIARNATIWCYGLRTLAYRRERRPELAADSAVHLETLLGKLRPVAFFAFGGMVAFGEYLVGLAQDGDSTAQSRLREYLGSLRPFARRFPIAQPALWRIRANWWQTQGRTRIATHARRQSLTTAIQRSIPYERGLAYLELARALPHSDPARRQYLIESREIFGALGASYLLAQVREILSGG